MVHDTVVGGLFINPWRRPSVHCTAARLPLSGARAAGKTCARGALWEGALEVGLGEAAGSGPAWASAKASAAAGLQSGSASEPPGPEN